VGILMSSTISPNMSLVIPGVGSEAGPLYATDVNNSLTLIDLHDHSEGRGVQITPAGLNINADLSINGNSITEALSIVLTTSASASTTALSLSAAPGGESPVRQDLWYTDDTGVQIQITKNGIVNATATSIDGESYSAGTFYWTQSQDSLPTTPANFDIGSITIRPNTAATTNGVKLQPASAISSQYSISLPLLPASQKIMSLDASGNMVATYIVDNSTIEISSNTIRVKDQGITAAKVLNNTLTTNQISLTAGITQGQLADSAFQWQSHTITADGTWVVPSGVNFLVIEACGGGGGGGGSGGNNNNVGSPKGGGGGGGAGAVIQSVRQVVTPGDTLTIAIGAGGTAGTAGSASSAAQGGTGGTGGSTTIAGTGVALTFLGGAGGGGGGGGTSTGANGAAGSNSLIYAVTGGAAGTLSGNNGGGGGGGASVNVAGNGGTGTQVGISGLNGSGGGGGAGSAAGGAGGTTIYAPTASSGGTGTSAGGGGGGGNAFGTGGNGGTGSTTPTAGSSAANNTGGGGGGGGGKNGGTATGTAGGTGGSGKVVIYYQVGG
jgi:hypothetical protein